MIIPLNCAKPCSRFCGHGVRGHDFQGGLQARVRRLTRARRGTCRAGGFWACFGPERRGTAPNAGEQPRAPGDASHP